MVTAADIIKFQQHFRQEIAEVTQQVHTELVETVNGRLDMLNIAAALQRLTYPISDLTPRNWAGSNDNG